MSVTVNLYTNTSDRDYVHKTLSDPIVKTCELKGDVDLRRPVLIVTGDASDYSLINYMSIPAFHRSYFVTCRALPGGLIEISGECDVLSSSWDYIKDSKAVIDRQENEYNLYLNDGTFSAYANDMVVTKTFSAGFSTPSYVMVVAG